MKKTLLLVVACFLCTSGPTFGSIVFNGSQFTLQLSSGMTMDSMTIEIADSSDAWDDFRVDLWYDDTMDMSHLRIYGPMGTDPTTGMPMPMGGIVGDRDSMQVPFAFNLSAGDPIRPDSPLTSVGWAVLHDMGVGQFGLDGGYIGLIMDMPGGSPHPAWLGMSRQWDTGEATHGVTFYGWAYESEAGKPIGAGAIPAPGAVVLGGLGIAFVTWLRRRRVI